MWEKTKMTTQVLLSVSAAITSNVIQCKYGTFDEWFKRWSQKTLRVNNSSVFRCVGSFTPIFGVTLTVTSHKEEILLTPNRLNCLVFPVFQPRTLSARSAESTIYRCPRRNVPDFGRVFLKLKYTDITQNTYIQS